LQTGLADTGRSRVKEQSTVFYRRVQTGRNRFGTVSFVSASIQHDVLLEAPALLKNSQMQSNTGNASNGPARPKNAQPLSRNYLHDKQERP
jgi:hypothetical protein